MFSLGVPSSCTIRSTCWISELPGSRGLWASSSARMQPTALWLGGDIVEPVTNMDHHTAWEEVSQPAAHHMSRAVVCDLVPRRSSGALYLHTRGGIEGRG